jgi:hypothetical protein
MSGKKQSRTAGADVCPNVTFEDNEFKNNKALNDQGNYYCHSPTQPQHELEL